MDNKKSNHNILKGYNLLFYFAGSMIMHEPSEECIVDFWEKGILKSLPVSSSNPNFIKAASQLRESFTDRKLFGKLLHEDYIQALSQEILLLWHLLMNLNIVTKYRNMLDFRSSECNRIL